MTKLEFKQNILDKCFSSVSIRIENAEKAISRSKEASLNETKSSAGDKYETGKAMMQTEIEKAQMQLNIAKRQEVILNTIDLKKEYNKIETGAMVNTNKGLFFISISAGKIKIEDTLIIAMAANAPLAQALLSKVIGSTVMFNGMDYEINSID